MLSDGAKTILPSDNGMNWHFCCLKVGWSHIATTDWRQAFSSPAVDCAAAWQ
jgi:hypothetical protein